MKKLLALSTMVLGMLLFGQTANAQGRWVSYPDSSNGRVVKCFMAYEGAVCQSPESLQQNNKTSQYGDKRYRSKRPDTNVVVVVVNQQPQYPDRIAPRQAVDQTDTPYYENQQRTTVRRSYGGGIDRWTRRPYGHYEVQTETVTVRASANSLTFRPNISISTTYWPSNKW